MIGLFSDSQGDLSAFDAAYNLLRSKGAKRFIFAGGRYTDLDDWISHRKERARGGKSYSDGDFLADVSNWLNSSAQVERPPAFGEEPSKPPMDPSEDPGFVKSRFLRVPEKGSLQYLDPTIDRKAVDMIGDTLATVVHDKNDLVKDDLLNASLFIHGKELQPKVVQIGPRFFVTPGRLVGAPEQTVGLIETVDRALTFSAFTLDGKCLIDRQALTGSVGKTKLSVK